MITTPLILRRREVSYLRVIFFLENYYMWALLQWVQFSCLVRSLSLWLCNLLNSVLLYQWLVNGRLGFFVGGEKCSCGHTFPSCNQSMMPAYYYYVPNNDFCTFSRRRNIMLISSTNPANDAHYYLQNNDLTKEEKPC